MLPVDSVWDLDACVEKSRLQGHSGGVFSLVIPNTKILVSSSTFDGTVMRWVDGG